jgi:hypothetical protein
MDPPLARVRHQPPIRAPTSVAGRRPSPHGGNPYPGTLPVALIDPEEGWVIERRITDAHRMGPRTRLLRGRRM